MEKIKRCPFCRNELLEIYDESANFYVFCSSCGAQGPFLKDKPAAITAWNVAANALIAKDAEIEQLRNGIDEALREAPDENSYSVYLDMVSVFRGEIKQLREERDKAREASLRDMDAARKVANFWYGKYWKERIGER